MRGTDLKRWMVSEATDLQQMAQRLERQFFQWGQAGDALCWEPSVDMYGDDRRLGVLVALPGVAPDRYQVTMDDMTVVVRGERMLDVSSTAGTILCMEIPYGRFERQIRLPYGGYRIADMQLVNGCLRLQLERIE
jgi:HSP20 family protein